jgi:hypothetical protein
MCITGLAIFLKTALFELLDDVQREHLTVDNRT